MRRTHLHSQLVDLREPQPGERVKLLGLHGEPDGRVTCVRQTLSSDHTLQMHEIRDDRGQFLIVEPDGGRTWVQVVPEDHKL